MSEWKRDWQSYSHDFQQENIHARVYIARKKDEHDKRKWKDTICARVWEVVKGEKDISENGFASIEEGQKWCEGWIAYLSENKTLKEEVARLKDWLHYKNERIDELQAKVHAYELEKIRMQFTTKEE